MTIFYEKTIYDKELAPFFILELGEDIKGKEWVEHIELLADFWLNQLLGENTYGGNFVGAHLNVPYIKKENFTKWMTLFSISLSEVYTKQVALDFKKKGALLSQKFIEELNL